MGVTREELIAPAARIAYGTMAMLLLVVIGGLITHAHGAIWGFADNWGLNFFEVAASGLCLARAFVGKRHRLAALLLGGGLLGWSLGDVVWSLETQGGGNPPTPSIADGFYLAFYPLAFFGLVLLMKADVKQPPLSTWLDGIVVSLGVTAITASFGFDTILKSLGGTAAALATNLAYPIGDLLLVALIGAVLAMLPTWRNPRWLVLALGCAIDAIGDIIYLFQSSAGTYRVGTLLDATWPTALLLVSFALWIPSKAVVRSRPEAPRFVLPVVASMFGLAVLVHSSLGHVNRIAVVLASGMFLAGIVRSALLFGNLRKMTEAKRIESITDELTGLGNRRLLMQLMEEHLSEHELGDRGFPLALLLIDLDHFKEINDSFGHAAGDEVLRQLGRRLQRVLAEGDTLCRIGGDEFGILLAGADARHATIVAERITDELIPPFHLEGATLHAGASIGIALVPDHANSTGALMRCADLTMYRAKTARQPYEIYERAIDDAYGRIQRLEDLRRAVEDGSLLLMYQPQYDLRTGKILGVEALLRWPHAELGIILPDEFIPLAEEAGLMTPLTEFVLESALGQCAAWCEQGFALRMAVNLSMTNLLDTGLPDRLEALLERHGLGHDRLVLEITETTLMADRQRSLAVLDRLVEVGVTISVDDFGTGLSSLSYLCDLAVGELKIDRTLIAPLGDDADSRRAAIVRTTIELGHLLGLRVVAEGVEDAETSEVLVSLGCDVAQGYFLSRPLSPEQVTVLLSAAAQSLVEAGPAPSGS